MANAFTEPQCLFYEGINGEFHFANRSGCGLHPVPPRPTVIVIGPLNSGEWNQFVGTYDQGLLELFINGVSATQQEVCSTSAGC